MFIYEIEKVKVVFWHKREFEGFVIDGDILRVGWGTRATWWNAQNPPHGSSNNPFTLTIHEPLHTLYFT